jgi:hypothetical protein
MTHARIQVRYQLLIEEKGFRRTPSGINIDSHIEGDCRWWSATTNLIKVQFHTNTPWKVLEYCATLGDIYGRRGGKYGAPGKRA